MATKDISDLQVVLAYLVARELRDTMTPEWPYKILQRVTGQCEKVCYRAMERAERRGLVDVGVSLRAGWVTEKGRELIKAACAERGVPVPPEANMPDFSPIGEGIAARIIVATQGGKLPLKLAALSGASHVMPRHDPP